jgi:hypothetical protein
MRNDRRSYDYGLRGYGETVSPRRMHAAGREGTSRGGPADGRLDRRSEPRTPRVTARYNRDYVAYDHDFSYGARGEGNYPRNFNMFTGDRPDRIGDPRYYRRPYTTIGGTRTFRGAREPMGYDRDFDVDDPELRRG